MNPVFFVLSNQVPSCVTEAPVSKGLEDLLYIIIVPGHEFFTAKGSTLVIGYPEKQNVLSFAEVIRYISSRYVSLYQCFKILYNYIEPGHPAFTDVFHADLSIAVIGDTHHMPAAWSFSYDFLYRNKHSVITSIANPTHLEFYSGLSDILLYWPHYSLSSRRGSLKSSLRALANGSHQYIGLCSTLTSFQYNRTRVLRRLLFSPFINRLLLYQYTSDQDLYYRTLSSLELSVVPSLSGQISPQIESSLSVGAVPVVDCVRQLSQHCFYEDVYSSCLDLISLLTCTEVELQELILHARKHLIAWQHRSHQLNASLGTHLSFFFHAYALSCGMIPSRIDGNTEEFILAASVAKNSNIAYDGCDHFKIARFLDLAFASAKHFGEFSVIKTNLSSADFQVLIRMVSTIPHYSLLPQSSCLLSGFDISSKQPDEHFSSSITLAGLDVGGIKNHLELRVGPASS